MKISNKHWIWVFTVPWALTLFLGSSDFGSATLYWGGLAYLIWLLLDVQKTGKGNPSLIGEIIILWAVAGTAIFMLYSSSYIISHPPTVPSYADSELIEKISELRKTLVELANELPGLAYPLLIGYGGYLIIKIVALVRKRGKKTKLAGGIDKGGIPT